MTVCACVGTCASRYRAFLRARRDLDREAKRRAGQANVVVVREGDDLGGGKGSGKGGLLSAYATSLMINNHPDILHQKLHVRRADAVACLHAGGDLGSGRVWCVLHSSSRMLIETKPLKRMPSNGCSKTSVPSQKLEPQSCDASNLRAAVFNRCTCAPRGVVTSRLSPTQVAASSVTRTRRRWMFLVALVSRRR